jgi:DNA helicase-2/ATP-dependent DNA helicase PcrA
VFLEEIRAACLDGGSGVVGVWTPQPAADATNPSAERVASAEWPADPLGHRRPAMSAAADLIRRMITDPDAAAAEEFAALAERDPEIGRRAGLAAGLVGLAEPDPEVEKGAVGVDNRADPDIDRWRREATMLLAEREERARRDGPIDVAVPDHLSVSQLVVLRRDPQALARSLRRPLPQRPTPYARRGTAFHAWLEQRFGSARLIDLDDLPGAADDDAAPDEELAVLQEAFLAGEWADRTPIEVEVPFATTIAGVVVRGRMDAVFLDGVNQAPIASPGPGARYDVIDWKTGRRPGPAEAAAGAVQLSAYRLAWAALAGVPVSRVRAGFHYVREGVTLRPADLLDADQLAALLADLPEQG